MNKKHYNRFMIAFFAAVIIIVGYILYNFYTKPVLLPVKPVSAKELITLYFYNPKTDTLNPEQRIVASTTNIPDKSKMIIAELEHGSMTGLSIPIPSDVKVNSVSREANGIISIDFSKNLVRETAEGSSAEITAIYSIVNSIAKNINGVKAVLITVNGKRLRTLKTHIEIDQPIIPDYTK